MKRFAWIVVLLLCVGCGQSPEARLVGRWQGKPEVEPTQVPKGKEYLTEFAKAGDQFARSLADKMVLDWELRADGTYTGGIGKHRGEGKWKVLETTPDTIKIATMVDDQTSEVVLTFDAPDKMRIQSEGAALVFIRQK